MVHNIIDRTIRFAQCIYGSYSSSCSTGLINWQLQDVKFRISQLVQYFLDQAHTVQTKSYSTTHTNNTQGMCPTQPYPQAHGENSWLQDIVWKLPRNNAKVVQFDIDTPLGIQDFLEYYYTYKMSQKRVRRMTIVEQLFKKIFPICSFSSRASPRSQGGSFHQRATTK